MGLFSSLSGGAGAAIGGSILSSAADIYMQNKSNKMNRDMAREQMVFNQAEARENREWQERMSNTAYQRSMEDMKAAGLNPMLAKMSGGASTPSGASASAGGFSGAKAAEISDKLSRGISTALEFRRLKKDIESADSTIALNKAAEETQKTQQQLNLSSAKEKEANAAITKILEQPAREKAKLDTLYHKFDQKTYLYDKGTEKVIKGGETVGSILGGVLGSIKKLFTKDKKLNKTGGNVFDRETGEVYTPWRP